MRLQYNVVVAILLILPLSACLEPVYDSARYAKAATERQGWKELARRGDIAAQYKVGTLYCCGERPMRDEVEALIWWCRAAKQNQRDALLEVGKIYADEYNLKGSPVPVDKALAHSYYTLAEEHGNEAATSYREALGATLTEVQWQRTRQFLQEWPNIPCELERRWLRRR